MGNANSDVDVKEEEIDDAKAKLKRIYDFIERVDNGEIKLNYVDSDGSDTSSAAIEEEAKRESESEQHQISILKSRLNEMSQEVAFYKKTIDDLRRNGLDISTKVSSSPEISPNGPQSGTNMELSSSRLGESSDESKSIFNKGNHNSGTKSNPYRLVMKRETRSASREIRTFEQHLEQNSADDPSHHQHDTFVKAHFRLLRANDEQCIYESRTDGEIMTTSSSQNLSRLVWSRGSRPRRVLVVRKPHDTDVEEKFQEVCDYLHFTMGLEVFCEPVVKKEYGAKKKKLLYLCTWNDEEAERLVSMIDFVVSIGGDGTLLWASHLFKRAVPPIMSFAMGSLGFLAPFSISSYKESLCRVVESGCNLSLRCRLMARILKKGQKGKCHSEWGFLEDDMVCGGFMPSRQRSIIGVNNIQGIDTIGNLPLRSNIKSPRTPRTPVEEASSESLDGTKEEEPIFIALNEVLVDRGPSLHLTNLDCYVDDVFLTKVQADGMIIATPTGSTAYSLSAGGPMVHPQVPGICFTPICPHSLSFRPMILPDSSTFRFVVSKDSRSSVVVSFDGRDRKTLHSGDAVEVKMCRYPVPSVCNGDETEDWFHAVSTVLQWNFRTHQKAHGNPTTDSNETKDIINKL